MDVERLAAEMVHLLADARVASPDELEGAEPGEIDALQERTGLRLPQSYRAFLLAMGRDAGLFYEGSDLFIDQLPLQREHYERLLRDNSGLALPADAFLFVGHQGSQFEYFLANGDEDPPIYHYGDDDPAPRRVFPTFTDWFKQSVIDHKAFVEEEG